MKKSYLTKNLKKNLYGGAMTDKEIVDELNKIASIINRKFENLETYYNIHINHKPLPIDNSDTLKNSTPSTTTSIAIGPFGEIIPVISSTIPSIYAIPTPLGMALVPTSASPSDTIEKRCDLFLNQLRIYNEITTEINDNYDKDDCIHGKSYYLKIKSAKPQSKNFKHLECVYTPHAKPSISGTPTDKENKLTDVVDKTNNITSI